MRFAVGFALGGGIGYATCWLIARRALADWQQEQARWRGQMTRLEQMQMQAKRSELDDALRALRAAGF